MHCIVELWLSAVGAKCGKLLVGSWKTSCPFSRTAVHLPECKWSTFDGSYWKY